MLKQLESRIKFIVPVFFGTVLFLCSLFGIFNSLDNKIYDSLLKLKCSINKSQQTSKIVSVDLTDNSELVMAEEIETRKAFLDSFTVLKKCPCVAGFDFVFSGDKDKSVDNSIANIVSELNKTVLAVTPLTKAETNFSGKMMSEEEMQILQKQIYHPIVKHGGTIPSVERFLFSYNELSKNAKNLSHIGIKADEDGVQRKIPLLYKWQDGYIPSYSLAIIVDYLSVDSSSIILDAGKSLTLPLDDGTKIRIPIDKNGMTYIPYTGSWSESAKHIPLEKFVQAASDEDAFWSIYDLIEDKIVLFSDLSTSKKDFGISPFEPVFPLAGLHSAVISGILTDSMFYPVQTSVKIILVLFLFALLIFCVTRKKNKTFNIFSFSVIFGIIFITVLCWFVFSIVPWCSGICISVFATWLASFIFRQADSYKEHLLMEHALSRYFPRALASRVLKEGKTDLAPAKKELTMLFSDIAGFTKFSSDKPPELVHAFLTDYLGSMAEIIFAHGGTVDKFIGDGILAFYGDPFEQPDYNRPFCQHKKVE